jgi:orsellinic acid C2-O-methyltransferase
MSENRTGNLESMSLAHRLLGCVTSSWMTQAIYVAAELRIADLLTEGPRTSEDLAAATGTHAPSLRRLLRALTTIEICREREDGSFEITPMGLLLGTDVPESLRSWTIWWGAHLWQVWGNLLYSVKTGESARKLLTGTDGFKHLEQDSEAAAVFNQALVELTRLTTENIMRIYDFSGLKRIVDVGGGHGELLISILRANPTSSGILFDLPHAIEGGRRRFEEAGLVCRCEFLEGDFFESVPKGADAYILKSIIHDWDDNKSKLILENCRHAMAEKGRLLLVERVLPERLEVSVDHQAVVRSDLTMLVALAAKERTETQFRELLNSAGFRVTRFLPAGMTFSVIEAFPFL